MLVYDGKRVATAKERADWRKMEKFLRSQDLDVFCEVYVAVSTNAFDPRKVRALNAVCRKYHLVPEVVMNWYYCDPMDE